MKRNTNDQATKDRRAELEVARDKSAKDHETKLEAARSEAEKAKIIADFFDIISRDLEHERATVEERHWQELEPLWTDSVSIHSITPRFADLGVPVQWSKRANKEISELDPDDCRQFCWRDCALYVNVLMDAAEGLRILKNDVYPAWLPHRAREQEMSYGSFFATLIRFWPPRDLTDVLSFHARLCPKLKSMEADVLERNFKAFHPKSKEPREGGLYQLRDTFSQAFIVIDRRSWRDDGALLVCKDEVAARALDLEEGTITVREGTTMVEEGILNVEGGTLTLKGGVGAERQRDLEEAGLAPACIYRLPLKRAMQAMVSQDEDIRKRRREWSHLTEEYYGSDDEL